MKNFNVEEQWLFYLQMMKLDINTMSEVQATETKRAFLGGLCQLFTYMRTDLPRMKENDAMKELNSIERQLNDQLKAQLKK